MYARPIARKSLKGKEGCLNLRSLLTTFALAIGTVPMASAAPVDGVVRAGSAQINSQGNNTYIQQASQRAIIDWRGFSISKDELVQFFQPSASSATLNRVTGDQVSMILGQLSANGQILLINPNGIIFGSGARINVGSLIASTANISNDNFMQGKLIFDQPGRPGAGIVNGGSITAAEGGLVALVAPYVRNDGLIQARLGKVMLGAADTFTIDLYGDGLVNLALSDASLNQLYDTTGQPIKSLITQAGKIDVGSGQAVLVTAQAAKGMLDNMINMSGVILADSAVEQGGRILLLANGGSTEVSGSMSATGTSGGQIEVLGDQVHLASTANLDASGSYGGGIVHVGGAYQGGGTTYRAQTTDIDAGAMLDASALTKGNAGEVIVWSDRTTDYAGTIQARGGEQGGDGGRVEVSGKQTLNFDGLVDAGASNGNAGTLLLDPTNFTIGISEAGLIDMVLRTGTSTAVSASGDINVNYVIDGRGRLAGGGLTLTAGNNVNVNDFIITNNGAINLFATAGTVHVASGKLVYAGTAPITVRSGATLTNAPYLTSGLLSLISTLGSVDISMGIDSAIGNLFIQAADDVDIEQPIVSLNDGNSVTVKAGNNIIVNAQVDGRPALNVNPNGTVSMTAGQNIDLNKSIVAHNIALTATVGTINAPTMTAGTVTLDVNGIPHGEGLFAGDGPISVTTGGNLSSGIYVTTGPVNIRSTGGDVTIDTKLAEILGDVSIKADSGSVNVDEEIANIRSGSNLLITAGTDINLNRQIDALDDSNPLSIVPVAGGSVTFAAGNNVNLNRDLATFDGPVNITATNGTLNIANELDLSNAFVRTYRIETGSAPISVTAGGNLSTGTKIPSNLVLPDCGAPCYFLVNGNPVYDNNNKPEYDTDKINAYIEQQLKPWVALSTTGKLSLISTGGDVTIDAPIPDTTGEIAINGENAVVVNGKLLSNNQPITLVAGNGGITVNDTNDTYGLTSIPNVLINDSQAINSGTGDLSLLSLGDVSISTNNGIHTAGKLTIDTRGQIIKGFVNNENTQSNPSEIDLTADLGIVSFFANFSPKITATSSQGSIDISVDSPTKLVINAAEDVHTGSFLGADAFIQAGNDINLINVLSSGKVVLQAGHDANLHEFLGITSLDVTAGNDVVFNCSINCTANKPTIHLYDQGESSSYDDGSHLTATSTGGNIDFNGYSAIHMGNASSLTLNAKNSVTLGLLESLGSVSITAQTGNITLNNDIGPVITGFDGAGVGVSSLLLDAGGNISMQGAKAVGTVNITSGGILTPAKGIYSGTTNGVTISATGGALEKLSGGDVSHSGPYSFTGTSFGDIPLGTQTKLDALLGVSPAISPGPAIAAPPLPTALTALAAQAPNLAGVAGSGIPGSSGAGAASDSSNSENATQSVSGNGTLSEIIPADDSTTVAGQSEDIVLVFEGGRGVAQSLDVGQGGGQTDADTLGDNCGPGKGNKSEAACK